MFILNFFKNFFTEDSKNLFLDLWNLSKNLKKLFIWFLLLPFTFIFLIINFTIYFFFIIYYNIIFFYKYLLLFLFNYSSLKPIKLNLKDNNNLSYFFLFKSIFFDNIKCRSFFNFYFIFEKIFKNDKNINQDYFSFFLYFIKTYSNRIIINLIFGVPYLVLYCNIWLTNKLFLIQKIHPLKKTGVSLYIFNIILNLNRDLTPDFINFINDLKISFSEKKITFNPNDIELQKAILNVAKETEFFKNVNMLKKNSVINLTQNIKLVENNKVSWTKPHIETSVILNEDEILYVNETSSQWLTRSIENYHYGDCTYKLGDCYITKPIVSKIEYKQLINNSINKKILDSTLNKTSYNQILSLICGIHTGYIEGELIEKENKLILKYSENKKNILYLIEKNKNFMSKEVYESLINSKLFFDKIENLNSNLSESEKIFLIKTSTQYHMLKDSLSVYDSLKI